MYNVATLAGLMVVTCVWAWAVPVFSYPNGQPVGCVRPSGYDAEAICEVPGETPLGSLPIPPAAVPFADANFGGTLRVLGNYDSQHTYSTISPFSATGRYTAVRLAAATAIVETASGRVIFANRPGNVAGLGIFWDGRNDDTYYFTAGSQLRRHTLSSNQTLRLYSRIHHDHQRRHGRHHCGQLVRVLGTGSTTGLRSQHRQS
jgi:hypothetical protein